MRPRPLARSSTFAPFAVMPRAAWSGKSLSAKHKLIERKTDELEND